MSNLTTTGGRQVPQTIMEAANGLKIRNEKVEVRMIRTLELVHELSKFVGARTEDVGANKQTAKFIMGQMDNYTFEEIKLAFRMAAAGDFQGVKLIPHISALVIGEVMSAYALKKQDKVREAQAEAQRLARMKEAQENQKSDDEIKEIMEAAYERVMMEYLLTGRITESSFHIFDYCINFGKFTVTPEQKKEAYHKAVEREVRRLKDQPKGTMAQARAVKGMLAGLTRGTSGIAIKLAKEALLVDHFEELKKNSENK